MDQPDLSPNLLDVASIMFLAGLEHAFPKLLGIMERSERDAREGLKLLRKLSNRANSEPITGLQEDLDELSKDPSLLKFVRRVLGGDVLYQRNTHRSWSGAGITASTAALVRQLTHMRGSSPSQWAGTNTKLVEFQLALQAWMSETQNALLRSAATKKKEIASEPIIREAITSLQNGDRVKAFEMLKSKTDKTEFSHVSIRLPTGYELEISPVNSVQPEPITTLKLDVDFDSLRPGQTVLLGNAKIGSSQYEFSVSLELPTNLFECASEFLSDSARYFNDFWDYERRSVIEFVACAMLDFDMNVDALETAVSSYLAKLKLQLNRSDTGDSTDALGLARHISMLAAASEHDQRVGKLRKIVLEVFKSEDLDDHAAVERKLRDDAQSLIKSAEFNARAADAEIKDDLDYTRIVFDLYQPKNDVSVSMSRLESLAIDALKRQHVEIASRVSLLRAALSEFAGSGARNGTVDRAAALLDPFTRGALLLEMMDLRALNLLSRRDTEFLSYRRQDSFALVTHIVEAEDNDTKSGTQRSGLWADYRDIQEDRALDAKSYSAKPGAKEWRLALMSVLQDAKRHIVFFSPGYFRSEPCLSELYSIALACIARSVSVTWVVVDGAAWSSKEKEDSLRTVEVDKLRELVRAWAGLSGKKFDQSSLDTVLNAKPLVEHAVSPYLEADCERLKKAFDSWRSFGVIPRWNY